MFAKFLKSLIDPEPAQLDEDDARLAMSALLVRIARTDGEYSQNEIARINRILQSRYSLSDEAVEALRANAEILEAEAPDTVRFTRAIKDAVSIEERHSVVEAMWQIVHADGNRGDEESSLLRLMAKLLGVTDRDSNIIRKRAERNLP